jgi:hypothetical protein
MIEQYQRAEDVQANSGYAHDLPLGEARLPGPSGLDQVVDSAPVTSNSMMTTFKIVWTKARHPYSGGINRAGAPSGDPCHSERGLPLCIWQPSRAGPSTRLVQP